MSNITYSINWMGVVNRQWYINNGLTRRVTKVLEEDSELTGRKKGDSYEYDEVIEEYSCGRIDVRGTDSKYGEEISVDPMRTEDWYTFGNWLSTVRTDDVWSLNDLVMMYERTNPKIRWWQSKCNGFCGEYECKENQANCKRIKR
jgi:hypothetical protein